MKTAIRRWKALQDGLDIVLIAFWTKIMHGFTFLHLRLYAIHQNTRNRFIEMVLLLLIFPVFEASNFSFKIAYLAGNRRIRRLYSNRFLLQIENDTVQFGNLSRYRRIRLEREQAAHNLE